MNSVSVDEVALVGTMSEDLYAIVPPASHRQVPVKERWVLGYLGPSQSQPTLQLYLGCL